MNKMSSQALLDSWSIPDTTRVRSISKWCWLWVQFLCCLRVRKRPYMVIGFDPAYGEDISLQVWGMIDNDGSFLISHIAPHNRQKGE